MTTCTTNAQQRNARDLCMGTKVERQLRTKNPPLFHRGTTKVNGSLYEKKGRDAQRIMHHCRSPNSLVPVILQASDSPCIWQGRIGRIHRVQLPIATSWPWHITCMVERASAHMPILNTRLETERKYTCRQLPQYAWRSSGYFLLRDTLLPNYIPCNCLRIC